MTYIVFRDETITASNNWKYYGNGVLQVDANYSYTQKYELESLLRGETPAYYRQKRNGALLPMQQYRRVSLSAEYVSGSYRSVHSSQPGTYGEYTGKPDLSPSNWALTEAEILDVADSEEIQYAVQKAAAKYYTDGFDALTFLAEFKQVIRMFQNLAPTLVGLVRRTPANQFGKKLADLDLQVRYGWRTLFYDLVEIKQLLDDLDKGRRDMFRAHSMSQGSVPSSTSVSTLNWVTGTWTFETTTDYTISYSGRVYGRSVPPKVTINPLLTAWEVVRLSFVVDWFVNVGQWLAAIQFISFHPEYVSGGGFYCFASRSTTGTVSPANGYIPTGSASFVSTAEIKARDPVGVVKLPIPKLRLDSWKILDLLALLIQALKGKGR